MNMMDACSIQVNPRERIYTQATCTDTKSSSRTARLTFTPPPPLPLPTGFAILRVCLDVWSYSHSQTQSAPPNRTQCLLLWCCNVPAERMSETV